MTRAVAAVVAALVLVTLPATAAAQPRDSLLNGPFRSEDLLNGPFRTGGYLDVPLSNANAEGVGGVNPDLPTDPVVLGAALDEARAAGVAPTRYAALLQQYWLTVATSKAGLDLNEWDPRRGLAANEGNLANTFRYYDRLQLENPDFLWTGQGGMAGPSFAAGIMDVDLGRVVLGVQGVTDAVAAIVGVLDDAARPVSVNLPVDVRSLLEVGRSITADDIARFQVRVIAMSKHIFMDLIPQHEAFLAGGVAAIGEYRDAGLIDGDAYAAWVDLASGEPDRVVAGNTRLLHREQYQAIGDQWDRAREDGGAVGRALTYLSTLAADPAIPGVVPPREASPLTLTASDVTGVAESGPRWHLQTPLPAFNWSDRDARWTYITEQMLPRYRDLKDNRPVLWRDTLTKPMEQQILDQRALSRLPQMLMSMARTLQARYY